jgi:ribosomal protein S18 acetylase RimI-like enzyme
MIYTAIMDTFTFEVANSEPNAENKQALVDGLLTYHKNHGHPRKTDVFSIFIKGSNNEPIGGIMVSFLWNGMHIDSLWVDEKYRKKGLGSKLMHMVEAEGIKRGSTVSYTDTFSWQAPEFYAKLGYSKYGEIKNFPKGNSLIYFKKDL